MFLEKIASLSARYDATAPGSLRGWVVDIILDDGCVLTMPAAPEIYYLPATADKSVIETATRKWLLEKSDYSLDKSQRML